MGFYLDCLRVGFGAPSAHHSFTLGGRCYMSRAEFYVAITTKPKLRRQNGVRKLASKFK